MLLGVLPMSHQVTSSIVYQLWARRTGVAADTACPHGGIAAVHLILRIDGSADNAEVDLDVDKRQERPKPAFHTPSLEGPFFSRPACSVSLQTKLSLLPKPIPLPQTTVRSCRNTGDAMFFLAHVVADGLTPLGGRVEWIAGTTSRRWRRSHKLPQRSARWPSQAAALRQSRSRSEAGL